MTPYIKDDKTAGCTYTLPCGKCPACVKRRISGWSFRLLQEERHASSAIFLTLTYDTKHVPISPKGFMTLKKRDVQLFMKKLRKAHAKNTQQPRTLKYYTVGEYGSDYSRPHYHLILFNARIELISPSWDLGSCHYGNVSGASVGYCLKYISKPGIIPMHQNDDRVPEFSLFSKGLGSSYLNPASVAYHKGDPAGRNYLTCPGGEKIAIPRYYKDKIYDENERALISNFTIQQHGEALEKALADPNYDQNRYNEQQAQIAAFRKQKTNTRKGLL